MGPVSHLLRRYISMTVERCGGSIMDMNEAAFLWTSDWKYCERDEISSHIHSDFSGFMSKDIPTTFRDPIRND